MSLGDMENPFPVWQSCLMRQAGISPAEFRQMRNRHCKKGVDFRVGALNHIEFTKAAAERLLALAQKMPQEAPPGARPASETHGADPVFMTQGTPFVEQPDVPMKVALLYPNRRFLRARISPTEMVNVKVRDNQLFRPGMAITARLVEGDLYEVSSRPTKESA